MRPAVVIASILLCPAAVAATIHIPADYSTIQAGIDAASNGDTVLVAPGTYVENIDFLGKAIIVTSESGPVLTVIDGGDPANIDLASTVSFKNSEGSDSILKGFTIANGSGTLVSGGQCGGGIYCDQASPTIEHNIITSNSCGDIYLGGSGGGIFSREGSPVIKDNLITNNGVASHYSGSAGGGLYCSGGLCLVKQNRIIENFAGGSGGGIVINSSGRIERNLIKDNEANNGPGIHCSGNVEIVGNIIESNSESEYGANGNGGGIHCSGSLVKIISNLIRSNYTTYSGGGIFCYRGTEAEIINNTICKNGTDFFLSVGGGGLFLDSDTVITAANNIFWANSAVSGEEIYLCDTYGPSTLTIDFSDVKGGLASVFVDAESVLNWGPDMIDLDPMFVDFSEYDFHLLYDSPCRDTGDSSAITELFDFEGDPRFAWGGTVDMGADEFYTHLYVTGDLTPGGNIEGKFVGMPGASPVGLFIGSGVRKTPAPTPYGDFYLLPPKILILLIPIPADGVLVIPTTVPMSPPAPYNLPTQGIVGLNSDSLTNLLVLEVR